MDEKVSDICPKRDMLNKHCNIIMVIVFLALIGGFIYKKYGFYYALNDDTTMQALASGSITGVPDGHLVYIMYPFGVIISSLFKIFPNFDWYGITLLLLLFTCYGLIIHRVVFYGSKNTNTLLLIRLIGIVVLIALIIDSAVLFTYTVVAGILASTAIFLILSAYAPTYREWIISWSLLLVAGIIREEVFYMVLPVLLIIYTGWIIKNINKEGSDNNKKTTFMDLLKANKNYLIKALVFLFVALMLFGICKFCNNVAYSKDPWKTYIYYATDTRRQIMDYYSWPAYEGNEEFWESLNITHDEYNCLPMYGILPHFDENAIEKIAELTKSTYEKETPLDVKVSNSYVAFIKAITFSEKRYWNILFALAVIIAILMCIKADRRVKIEVISISIIVLAEFVYLCYRGRIPERVIAIFDYECVLGVLGLLYSECRHKKSFIFRGVYILFFIVTTFLCTLMYREKCERLAVHRHNINNSKEMMDYFNQNPDSFFVVPTGGFVPEKQFTIHQIDENVYNTAGTLTWTVFSPWMEECFVSNGIDSNSNYLLDDNVYMFTDNLIFADILNKYYFSENIIDTDYEVVEVVDFSDGRTFWLIKWHPPIE